ncbi:hypothetical protein DdX_10735 [Ditylenchus destructor]|uniref:F-box domain-containing protein n=1 Tax=Ditylenchus destructor TaxID=166010 RepID=A0AAD4MYK2_9BILA|nr:hypothetical protein DdX_10735 [Ditylenchus destructor]
MDTDKNIRNRKRPVVEDLDEPKEAVSVNEVKTRRPHTKATPRPIAALYFTVIRESFAFCDRKNLSNLRLVNKNFNDIVEREFASAPYLVLKELNYNDTEWNFEAKDRFRTLKKKALRQIPGSKFLRFSEVYIAFDGNFCPKDALKMSHIWEDSILDISSTNDVTLTRELVCSLTTCMELRIVSLNAMSFLRESISGSCRDVSIWDVGYSPDEVQVPWAVILDFMFASALDSGTRRSLSIQTEQLPDPEQSVGFINTVKERFEASKLPLYFYLSWHADIHGRGYDRYGQVYTSSHHRNLRSMQCLMVDGYESGFTLEIRDEC